MLIHIDTHSGTPIYRQLVDQITLFAMTGQLSPGDQLESVSALSKRIRVNPMTVSKAYSYLVQEGLLVRKSGVGVFVSEIAVSEQKQASNRLLTDAMKQAASLAAQLSVDEDEAVNQFREKFRQAARQSDKDKGNK